MEKNTFQRIFGNCWCECQSAISVKALNGYKPCPLSTDQRNNRTNKPAEMQAETGLRSSRLCARMVAILTVESEQQRGRADHRLAADDADFGVVAVQLVDGATSVPGTRRQHPGLPRSGAVACRARPLPYHGVRGPAS